MTNQYTHFLSCVCGCGRTSEEPKYVPWVHLHVPAPHWATDELSDERTEDDDKL